MSEENLLKMDGYNNCLIGKISGAGIPDKLCYSYDLVIKENMNMGMTYEEAVEYFEFNQRGAYVGEHTPCFLENIAFTDEEL
jgi:hypothetical protein|tara:strand:+ start:3024 stop:3269 length:246 start_codon:yes stop_codon:yes gene_type:complete